MSGGEGDPQISIGWQGCASWLIRCGVLRADHRANWPSATTVDLAYVLRDGVLLCNLINTIEPGCIDMKDVNLKPQMAQFLCLKNIKIFLASCTTTFGLSDADLFEPGMLFDLSNFHRVLCTLSAVSNTEQFRRKGIQGFVIGKGRSQEDMYKDLQSAGAGREDEGRRRRCRRRESTDSDNDEVDHADQVGDEEEGYGATFINQATSKRAYHYLCNLNLPSSLNSAQEGAAAGGEKRDFVVQELVETEYNYTEVLNNLLRYFARPLAAVMESKDWSRIFFGIKDLAEIHAGFHSQLRKARTGADLAQVFLDWQEKLIFYGDYCANLTAAQTTLHEICTNNETINQHVTHCQQEANNGRFKLRDILSVPMQRILKYHLLLEKLAEETPETWTEDHRQLTLAKDVMIDVAQYINEVKRDSDTLLIINAMERSIVDWQKPDDLQLRDYGRLLKDGELKVKAHGDQRVKARYAFVFEQVVLVCKVGRGDQYSFRETIKLDEYRIEDHTGRRTLGRDSRWSYQWLLVHKQGCKAYTLYVKQEDEKKAWIKALQDAMDNLNPAACRNTNHKYRLTTFENAMTCQRCNKFLKGRIFQGYSCEVCRISVHKQCIAHSGRCMPIPPLPMRPPPVLCDRALTVKLWFVGEMGRETAAHKLEPRENGTYMLRVRPTGQPRLEHETNYALSLKAKDMTKHIRVFKRNVCGEDLYYLSESRYFKSVIELVEYYERASLKENFEKLDQRLLWPFRRVIAKALFDFRGGERNQLSLRKGCRVIVFSKEGDAKGWWKGKISDQVGFFPKEYVEEEQSIVV